MDTDELSKESCSGILLQAEKYHHDLTLQFGVLSHDCENEEEFIEASIGLIRELKMAEADEIEDVFFGEKQNLTKLYKALDKILANIEKVKTIPFKKRHFEF
ncbi:MAG TPA: hypothetical protein VI583_12645 [Cyclobacteriaceae bacterium]|nr:hypothetical protein [Cyclobacteriaceae bacterium]